MQLGTIGSLLNSNENDEENIIESAVNVLSKCLSLEKLHNKNLFYVSPFLHQNRIHRNTL